MCILQQNFVHKNVFLFIFYIKNVCEEKSNLNWLHTSSKNFKLWDATRWVKRASWDASKLLPFSDLHCWDVTYQQNITWDANSVTDLRMDKTKYQNFVSEMVHNLPAKFTTWSKYLFLGDVELIAMTLPTDIVTPTLWATNSYEG